MKRELLTLAIAALGIFKCQAQAPYQFPSQLYIQNNTGCDWLADLYVDSVGGPADWFRIPGSTVIPSGVNVFFDIIYHQPLWRDGNGVPGNPNMIPPVVIGGQSASVIYAAFLATRVQILSHLDMTRPELRRFCLTRLLHSIPTVASRATASS